MNTQHDPITSGCIDKWKRHLLDLTGRNRALYYRPARTTVTIYQQPETTWKALVEDEYINLDRKVLLAPSVKPEDEARLEEETARRIKAISEVARVFVDEQGVHVTHAVFGWLQWVDDTRPPRPHEETVTIRNGKVGRLVRSPLLFVPVTIERRRNSARAVLERNAAIESNITLEYALASLYGIDIQWDAEADLDPETVIRAWQQATKGREHWRVDPGADVVIDTFSFKKIALLREMERSRDRIEKQPVLRALCGDAIDLLEAPPVPSFEQLDEVVSAEGLSPVVPADASQLKAIIAVNRGINLVIQGPPGTGKSQTITNLISTLVANGKRVLFVAEKRQARDVVMDNLATAGLSEVTLHITEEVLGRRGSAASKQDIADQLGEILGLGPGMYESSDHSSQTHDQIKGELNRYVRMLHEPLGRATRSTPFDLIGAWAECENEYPASLAVELGLPGIREIDDTWKRQALELASRIDDLGESVLSSAQSPWLDCALDVLDGELEARLKTSLSHLCRAPEQFDGAVGLHNLSYAFSENKWGFEDAERLLETLGAIAAHHAAKRQLLSPLRLSFWRTKKVFEQFQNMGGARAESARTTTKELRQRLQEIRDAQQFVSDVFPANGSPKSMSDLAVFASQLMESIDSARDAITVRSRCSVAKELGLTEALLTLVKARPPGYTVRRLLEMALARQWAKEAMVSDLCFQSEGPARVRLIEQLRESEYQAGLAARAATLNATAPYRPGNMDVAPRGTELWALRSQINAKRRRPLRWLFTHSPNVILQAKPCIVASPLAVAQFLHAEPYEFDAVIFDEASQIPTADAVVPISRAKQVVVVGDSQQMPPTNFFDREAPLEDDPEEAVYDSVLSECETLLPSRPLLWHYRSQDERLIAFSNRNFYKGDLLTFPSSWQERPDMGIKFYLLPDAVYGRGGSRANPDEAQKVVEILEEELEKNPEHDVGVTAMSVAQSVEIRARIEATAQDNPLLQKWLDEGGRARNLETIQGDEFDVSILSFGYGRDSAGNLQLNFGPLSREDGYKRLNVAVTRARKKTIVVSSIRAADIPAGRVGAGGQYVRQYLDYAERGPIALAGAVSVGAVDVYETPFEEEVALELRNLGWSLDTQVGVGKFRVDIGVKHPDHAGLYLAGIECDGATYHSAETARDRDIGRQEVLKRLGWNIYRIWSPDWFRDRRRVLNSLQAYLDGILGDHSSGDSYSSNTTRAERQSPPIRNKAPVFKPLEHGVRPGTVPYRIEGPMPFPQGYESDQWKSWLIEKVRVEGPWDETELAGMASLGTRFGANQTRRLLREAVSEGRLVVREGRLWHPNNDPHLVPVKVSRGDFRRDLALYSDLELMRALELACSVVGSTPGVELPTLAARLLGFPRTTQTVRERFESLMVRASSEGYLVQSGDYYRANHRNPTGMSLPDLQSALEEIETVAPRSGRLLKSQLRPGQAGVKPDLSLFLEAATSRKPLRIQYQSGSGQRTTRTVDVYGVGINYFDAFDHLRGEQRTFRIDRVTKAEWARANPFPPPRHYSPSSWVMREGGV